MNTDMSIDSNLKEIVEELKRYLEFQESMGLKTVTAYNKETENGTQLITEKEVPRTEPMAMKNNQTEEDIIIILSLIHI